MGDLETYLEHPLRTEIKKLEQRIEEMEDERQDIECNAFRAGRSLASGGEPIADWKWTLGAYLSRDRSAPE